MTGRGIWRYAGAAQMTGRASRAQRLAPSFLVVVTALACGSSHSGTGDEEPSGGGTAGISGEGGSGNVGTAGTGANPPYPGTGGATTGGVGTAGTFGVAGAGGFSVAGAGGFGATGGVPIGGGGGAGGAVSYPPGTCPAQPPPNGTSCAAYQADPGFHCYYDAPACRVVSTCLADDKWRSGCEAPGTGGEAGAPSDAGAGGI